MEFAHFVVLDFLFFGETIRSCGKMRVYLPRSCFQIYLCGDSPALDVFIRLNGWTCDLYLDEFLVKKNVISQPQFNDRYNNIVHRYHLKKKEEKPYKKERTEKILTGEIVVDPSDQASILAAIDQEIKLLQSSHMVKKVRENNGYYRGKTLYEGDFFIKFGRLDEEGCFKEYSGEEFCYSDYYETLFNFEEGKQRLYTYVKLLTAYLQNGIGSRFVITDEGILHSYAFLWLLMHDPKAHHLFPAYQLAAGEWRSLTENEPEDHHYMIEACLKDCKEVAHTIVNLLSESGDYMLESMKENLDEFPFQRFIEDEEWLEELHRAFAAAFIDERAEDDDEELTEVDFDEIEEDFESYFQNILLEYIERYFFDEDFDKAAENPDKLLDIYAELKGKKVEDISEWTAEWLNKLSKLYPVFRDLDELIDLQKIHQIVQKTIDGEIDFPRGFGLWINIDDLPELTAINSEDDRDLLMQL